MAAAIETSRYLADTIIPIKPPWRSANIITLSIGVLSIIIPAAPMKSTPTDTFVKVTRSRKGYIYSTIFIILIF
jgi:hypothetical protein